MLQAYPLKVSGNLNLLIKSSCIMMRSETLCPELFERKYRWMFYNLSKQRIRN